MSSVPDDMAKLCTSALRPPCHTLLTDASGVIANEAKSPRHVCLEVYARLRTQWATDFEPYLLARYPFLDVVLFESPRPVPIGKESVKDDPMLGGFVDAQPLDHLAVFRGNEHTHFPLTVDFGHTTCEAFFLEEPDDEGDFVRWKSSSVKFRIVGDPTSPGAAAFIENARAWWRLFGADIARRPGRPRGIRPPDDAKSMIRKYLGSLQPGDTVRLGDFQKVFGYDESTWLRHTAVWGKNWSQLL